MAISALEKDTLAKLFALSKQVLNDVVPRLHSLNEIYNSAGGVKETLTQAELDELPDLSGITKQTIDDAVYALSTNVLPALEAAYPSLAQCAARFL